MLDANIDTLGDDTMTHTLVDDDTNGVSSDVEHATCFAVIESMGHTFLNSTISFDVDDVTTFVYFHVDRQRNATILLEIAGEQVTRTTTITLWIGHSSSGTDETKVFISW